MFSERLKQLRLEANLTQKEIAEKLNISQPSYADWERDKKKPTPEKLKKLSEILKVSTDYLLDISDQKNQDDYDLSNAEILFRSTVSELNLNAQQKEQFKRDITNFIKQRKEAFKDNQ
ncbi:helix-turn-helix domain-containing protein [Streptococcus uberis]|uniref:helix-turn-helix domain-containing protein n=1 Tax=Streptococcus uberis TaxID=1349 RepID=UPI001939B33F|nr:helix-turn-helix transcriptional regulator [Streptococcus uberis]